jgi:exonuclease III
MQQSKLRIATWNICMFSAKKREHIHQQIMQVDADIIVLTETHPEVKLPGYTVCNSKPYGRGRIDIGIWTRLPVINILPTYDPESVACIEVATDWGALLVYGTILPYYGYAGSDGKSKGWQEHYLAVEKQSKDWSMLQADKPDAQLCVAGDFNQVRDGSKSDGAKSRMLLDEQLRHNRVVPLTDENLVVTGKLKSRRNIDHICLSEVLSRKMRCVVEAWENITPSGQNMSDHNGVLVDLRDCEAKALDK